MLQVESGRGFNPTAAPRLKPRSPGGDTGCEWGHSGAQPQVTGHSFGVTSPARIAPRGWLQGEPLDPGSQGQVGKRELCGDENRAKT